MFESGSLARRDFLKTGTVGAAGLMLNPMAFGSTPKNSAKPVRIGCVGMGGRGTHLMKIILNMPGVEIPAVCDIIPAHAEQAQDIIAKAGRAKPEAYIKSERDYRRLMNRDDLDAVIIATPWEWHARMAVDAMKAGKYAAVEVPCAITLEECWDLVKTHEATGVPCMMLENWSFRRDNLAVLNMIREGLFGEIVHCHCAHSHNCIYWYFDGHGNLKRLLLPEDTDFHPLLKEFGRIEDAP